MSRLPKLAAVLAREVTLSLAASFPVRLLRNPRFVRLAAKFPLTRPIARREARALFDICAGFVYSQTLLACVQLKLFEHLAEEPLDEAILAKRMGLDASMARRLLTASSALRLTKKLEENRWDLARLGAAVLASPGLSAMVEHHSVLYRDLLDPIRLLKGERNTGLADYWPYANERSHGSGGPQEAAAYTELMAATLPALAEEILDAIPLHRFNCLMDAGGGDGTFLAAAANRAPDLKLKLFDLPEVAGRARENLQRKNLLSRVEIAEGDMKRQPLPAGADAIALIRIILDHGDEAALRILRNARQALEKGRALILAEPMAETAGAESLGAYFAFYLLAMGGGRPRTKSELTKLLHEAGFRKVNELKTCQPLVTRILLAV